MAAANRTEVSFDPVGHGQVEPHQPPGHSKGDQQERQDGARILTGCRATGCGVGHGMLRRSIADNLPVRLPEAIDLAQLRVSRPGGKPDGSAESGCLWVLMEINARPLIH